MPGLEKLEILIYPQKICYAVKNLGFRQIIRFFSISNLTEIKQYQFSWRVVKLAKIKQKSNEKSNKFAYLIRTNYVNTKYIYISHPIHKPECSL